MSIRTFCIAATLFAGLAVAAAQDEPSEAAGNASNTSTFPEVELDTTEGKILIELNSEKAPKTVANFLEYVESGHYDGTVFHRVIDGFMIQGGGMDGTLKEKETKPPIRNEAGQWTDQQEIHPGHGPHQRPAQRNLSVLHQYR